jgi:hypothetical protein
MMSLRFCFELLLSLVLAKRRLHMVQVRVYLRVLYPRGAKKTVSYPPNFLVGGLILGQRTFLSEHPIGNPARCQVQPQKSVSSV